MAGKASHRRKIRNKIKKSPIILMVIILLAAAGILFWQFGGELMLQGGKTEEESTVAEIVVPPEIIEEAEEVTFHVIDVGQGDAILIKTRSGNMLIDSGDLGSEPRALLDNYLKAQNVESFEYVVFTHTDADHIGSADFIIENYDVKNVIMPDFTATTKTYNRLISAIENKSLNVILVGEDEEICVQSGYSFYLGPILNTVMAPTEDFKDSNEMSVVIKSEYGETSILFTGDAEKKSEAAMLEKYVNGEIDCDILKVGHHGSRSSTTKEFLDSVSPEIAVISCGTDNSYGHPHSETMQTLGEANVTVYRTDENGSVVITTDGNVYTIETAK